MNRISLLTLAMLLSACAGQAPQQAATLATAMSEHVNTLNQETGAFVAQANDMRQVSAAQLANQQTRTNSELAYNATILTEWKVAGNKKLVDAMDILEKQATSDMAVTASDLKQQQDAQNELAASFGKISYDPKKLQDVVAQLQSLAQEDSTTNQLQSAQEFAAAVLKDMKQQTGSATNDLGAATGAATKVQTQIAGDSPKVSITKQ